MKTILQEEGTIHCSITIWFTNLFLCLKPWKYPQQKQQWTKNGRILKRFRRGTGAEGGGPQGRRSTGGGGLARVPNLRVCKHPDWRLAHAGWEGWINILPGYRLVGVDKTSSETQRRKRRAARKGTWPPRGTENRQSPPTLEVRPGNRQGWWKRSEFRCNGRQLTLDKTVGSGVWWQTQGSSGRPASDLGWGSSSKTTPAGVAIDWVTGRSYSSARRRIDVQSGQRKGRKGAAAPYLSVAFRDRGHWRGDAGSGWACWKSGVDCSLRVEKMFAPGCASKAGRVSAGEEPEDHKRTKVRNKSEVIDEARTKGAKVHFASLIDICHLKNADLETKHQKYKGRVVLRGDIVKDDSGSYAVFTEQGSSASQMTAAKVMEISSPDCQDAQDK